MQGVGREDCTCLPLTCPYPSRGWGLIKVGWSRGERILGVVSLGTEERWAVVGMETHGVRILALGEL